MPERISGLLLVCGGVKIRKEDRGLPDDAGVIETDTWLATVPADLRDRLSLALGNRTPQIAQLGSGAWERFVMGREAGPLWSHESDESVDDSSCHCRLAPRWYLPWCGQEAGAGQQ
jgi:hypothetical protein